MSGVRLYAEFRSKFKTPDMAWYKDPTTNQTSVDRDSSTTIDPSHRVVGIESGKNKDNTNFNH
jgi:hypothetical protein